MNAGAIEARRWFLQAQADLEVVRTLQAGGHYAAACFHCQQAAEKALKALLYSQGSRVVLGHSVRELARQCQAHDPAFTEVMGEAALLDQFYIPTRYPNGLPAPAVPSEIYTAAQAETAQEAAQRLLDRVQTFLRTRTSALEA
jgi:HEPN domain-containing protein